MSVEFWVQFIVAVITIFASIISVVSLHGKTPKLICASLFIALGVVWVLLLRSQIAAADKSASELKGTLVKLGASQEQLETTQKGKRPEWTALTSGVGHFSVQMVTLDQVR